MGLGDMGIEFENLEGFKIPTLLIAGGKDRLFSPQLLEEVAQIIPGSRFEIIESSGHSPYFETPEKYNNLVMEFLEAHTQ
jgi:pimeloyl-ACP methyl ester carboxylesterase